MCKPLSLISNEINNKSDPVFSSAVTECCIGLGWVLGLFGLSFNQSKGTQSCNIEDFWFCKPQTCLNKLTEECRRMKGTEQWKDDVGLPVMSLRRSGLTEHVASGLKWLEVRGGKEQWYAEKLP